MVAGKGMRENQGSLPQSKPAILPVGADAHIRPKGNYGLPRLRLAMTKAGRLVAFRGNWFGREKVSPSVSYGYDVPFAVPEKTVGHSVLFLGFFDRGTSSKRTSLISFSTLRKLICFVVSPLPKKHRFSGNPFFSPYIRHRRRSGSLPSSEGAEQVVLPF